MANERLTSRQSQRVSEFQVINKVISDSAIAAYKEDGVVCLRNAFSQHWLDVIERGILQALSGASENLDVVKKPEDDGQFSVSSQAWHNVDANQCILALLRTY